jgi:hypothetical protein
LRLNPTHKKLLNFGAKLLIALLLAWSLYRQVFSRENFQEWWQVLLSKFSYPHLWWMLVTLLLVPLNLAFETWKWRQLIRTFSHIGFWRAYRAILSGVTIAIFTPNRVGEYGGRVLFVESGQGWKAVIATLVGSLAQLMVILSAGLAGALYFSRRYLSPEPYMLPVALCLGSLLLSMLVFGYFNVDMVIPLAKRIPHIDRVKKHLRHLTVLRHYTRRELGGALQFAVLRYLTYTFQYFFLLRFFGIPVPLTDGLAGIATIFFVQASIPLPPVMGLLARGEIALFVWGVFSRNDVGILAATFTLFVINIAVPALLGLGCIVRTNILKSLGYENGTRP